MIATNQAPAAIDRVGWVPPVILLGTFILSCVRSFLYPLAGDEWLTFYTVNQPSLLRVIHLQNTAPLVLEPPAFDLFAHLSGLPFHYSPLSVRMVSILSVVLIQICLYGIVKPISGKRAALLSMVLAINVPAMGYGFVLRPYAFLMAASAAALFCWQHAAYQTRHRKLALAGVAVSLALAITCQFYGFLAVLPLLAGELLRGRQTGRFDKGIWAAIAVGACSVALDIPSFKATVPYKAHMPRPSDMGLHSILWTYRGLLGRAGNLPLESMRHSRLGSLFYSTVLLALLLVLVRLGYRRFRSTEAGRFMPAGVALLTLTLVPLVCVSIAFFYTHVFWPRHCCECVIGAIALFSIAVSRMLDRIGSAGTIAVVLALAVLAVHDYRPRIDELTSTMQIFPGEYPIPAQVENAIPGQPIYADADTCLDISGFKDPTLFARVRCIYSQDREIKYIHNQIAALTGMSLTRNTSFPMQFVPYEKLSAHLPAILLYKSLDSGRWIPDSLRDDGASMQIIAPGPSEDPSVNFYLITPSTRPNETPAPATQP
jgi:hypothetical protein